MKLKSKNITPLSYNLYWVILRYIKFPWGEAWKCLTGRYDKWVGKWELKGGLKLCENDGLHEAKNQYCFSYDWSPGSCCGGIQLRNGSANFSCYTEHGPLSSGRQETGYILLFYKVRMCDRLIDEVCPFVVIECYCSLSRVGVHCSTILLSWSYC